MNVWVYFLSFARSRRVGCEKAKRFGPGSSESPWAAVPRPPSLPTPSVAGGWPPLPDVSAEASGHRLLGELTMHITATLQESLGSFVSRFS